jgi:hypothetical protein
MKNQNLENMLNNLAQYAGFKQDRQTAFATRTCVQCGNEAREFADVISSREYNISGMCQVCQDKIFVEDED